MLVTPVPAITPGEASSAPATALVYFGTYTGPASAGIYVSRFDPSSGRLSPPQLAAATTNPSFLSVHPGGRHLYAVNEIDAFAGEEAGAASAFAIDRSTGMLRLLGQVSTRGATPCHLSTDPDGTYLFVANYGGGSVAVLPIHADGTLGPASSVVQHQGRGPNRERQEGPHAHQATLDPSGTLLWVADLGIDQLLAHRFDATTGKLSAPPASVAALAAGSGPRHFAFTHSGEHLFVVGELSLDVAVLRVDPRTGAVSRLQTTSLLAERVAPSPAFKAAEIQLHPSGRILYASTRGADTITVFSVAPQTGLLTRVQVVPADGKTPRAFTLDATGRWLLAANQDSNEVVVFRVDEATGRLSRTETRVRVGAPVSVVFAR